MERDAFHVAYLSDKILEAAFHGQALKTVDYLRVETAQQDLRSQHLAILEYACKHDFRIDDFIEATGQSPTLGHGDRGFLWVWHRLQPCMSGSFALMAVTSSHIPAIIVRATSRTY